MKTIPCTIEILSAHSEDCWIITVPTAVVDTAAAVISELLSGIRTRMVFLDRKREFALTADTAACNGRSIPVTGTFLECLEKLFSVNIRPGISHLDWEFSDQYGGLDLTIRIGDMRYK